MNYITVIAEDSKEANDSFLASLKQHGGGAEGDILTVICSKWTPEYNLDFKERASKYFGGVLLFQRSLCPSGGCEAEVYSEEAFCKNIYFANTHGKACYIPMGYYVTEKGWSKTISDSYRLSGKQWMGKTALYEPATGSRVMQGPFVTDAYNFVVIPMMRTYHKVLPVLERARHYVARSFHDVSLPFAKGVFEVPVAPVETSEDKFSVDTPKKIESLPAAKKATRKRAKKKVAKRKRATKRAPAKKPISPDVVKEATSTLNS
jgi:hypothetical protein